MRFIKDPQYSYDDVAIQQNHSNVGSRSHVNLIRKFKTHHSKVEFEGIPIVVANLDACGQMGIAKVLKPHKMFVCLHKFYKDEELIGFFNTEDSSHSFYTLGITDEDIQKLEFVAKYAKLPLLCVDVAHGATRFFEKKIKLIRDKFPQSALMVGNVAIPEAVHSLALYNEADIIKVGIAPGFLCRTSQTTGVYHAQFSTVYELSHITRGLKVLLCGDGGIKHVGDFSKALAGGADLVMAGTVFCGFDENEGVWEYGPEVVKGENGVPCHTGKQIKKHQLAFGMSSAEIQDKYYGGLKKYRASEGACVKIPYKGSIENYLQQIEGGLRSAASYIGTDDIKHFHKCAVVRVNY